MWEGKSERGDPKGAAYTCNVTAVCVGGRCGYGAKIWKYRDCHGSLSCFDLDYIMKDVPDLMVCRVGYLGPVE